MIWWDDTAQRHRSTLPHKIFYVWGWPFFRFFLHRCMTPEMAHWIAIHVAINTIDRIERAWLVLCRTTRASWWIATLPLYIVGSAVLAHLLVIPILLGPPPQRTPL
jgi:hypothetical protein